MKVLIALGNPYPASTAFAGRMQKFGRGLMEAGADVLLLRQQTAERGMPMSGEDAYGVRYETVDVGYVDFRDKIRKRTLTIDSTLRAVERKLSEHSYDAVIAYGQSWYCLNQSYRLLGKLLRVCHTHNALCLMDCTEWHALSRMTLLTGVALDQWLVTHRMLPRLDGIIGISHLWLDYAARHRVEAIHIPSLGEADMPVPPAERKAGPFRLTYLGPMAGRDLPTTMLESVRLACRRGLDVELIVVGAVDRTKEGRDARKAVAADAELSARVCFTGWVSDSEVAQRLWDADALVLLRDNRWMDRACFPTRLPEYLRTGRPVILADTGDMNAYFKHGESAWLIPSGHCPEAVVDAMMAMHQDVGLARRIGLGGQKASVQFSYRTHGERLARFLEELRKARLR